MRFALWIIAVALALPMALRAEDRPGKSELKDLLIERLKKADIPDIKELWKLGAEVDSGLADVVNDRQLEATIRQKAIRCMGGFQTKKARQLLRSIVTDPAWHKEFRVVGIVSFAESLGEEALDTVRGFCKDPDSEVRYACVRALDVIGGETVLGFLRDLQLRERAPLVLSAIEKAINRLSKPIWEESE